MTMKTPKTKRKVKEAYFDWLYQQIEVKEFPDLEDFLYEIHLSPFLCKIPNDDNRAEDGLVLRERFADKQNIFSKDVLTGPCTILEMLIALADRMDFILFDPAKGSQMPVYFWLFINNLKLKKYNSNDEDAIQKKKYNRIVIKKLVSREYQNNGMGGLFPLNSPSSDQRNVEIWYQMMDYIGENYDI